MKTNAKLEVFTHFLLAVELKRGPIRFHTACNRVYRT
jgi:hypothetical protein